MNLKRKKKSFFLHRLKAKHHPFLFRRLAVLWVVLIILEIGCPLFECQSFAAELPNGNSSITSADFLKDNFQLPKTLSKTDLKSQDDSITADDQSVTDQQIQNEDCNDECLCHITPINVLVFEMPKHFLHASASPIVLKFQPASDLPPPYQPPQFS